ncbi:hypothetical protein BURK1_00316 [Burkholderiales bacterium]|nr:hypothetical protein BURK1_00316 [Burkholderiales bacterium]
MKKISLTLLVCTVPLLATSVASAQGGGMMGGDGSMWGGGWMGGYGGIWLPALVVVAVVGLVVWIMRQKGK